MFGRLHFRDESRSRSPPRRFTGESCVWALAKGARQPQRDRLQQEARTLANGAVSRALGPDFVFEERGSLFTPYLRDVTDIDIQMFNTRGGSEVGNRASEALLKLASSLFCRPVSVRVVSRGGQQREMPWHAFQGEKHLAGRNEAVVVSGIYKTQGGFLLPIDIAASVGREKESPEERIAKIAQKAAEGDYAKILQKIRGMVRQPLKSQIADSVNANIGPLRFVVKQLSLLHDYPDLVDAQNYLTTILGLRISSSIAITRSDSEKEMQSRAKRALASFKRQVADSLPWDLERRFLDAVRHV